MMDDALSGVIFEIKSRLRDYIVDVRGKTINSTGHFKCPITYNHKHGDSTPSCHYEMRDGIGVWYCHTCQTGGTIYDLLYHEENIPIDGPAFLEATSYLAQKLQIFFDTDLIKNADYTKYARESGILSIYQDIEEYLIKNGDPVESLGDVDFGRGYSPSMAADIIGLVPLGSVDHNQLFSYLESKYGDTFRETSLYKYTRPDTVFSKNTLTLSYRDQRGNPIRFIGRYRNSYRSSIVDEERKVSKYIQTVGLFGKTKEVPFLLDIAQEHIRKTRSAIITEGEFDALALHLMGFKNAIASRGVSITEKFIDMLYHMRVNDVTLILDNDHAAMMSINKYYQYFANHEIAVYVLPVEPGSDPDSMLKDGESVELADRVDAVTYLLRNFRDYSDPFLPETVRYHNCISFLAENIQMQAYQQKYSEEVLAEAFGFHADIIFNDIRNYSIGLETKDVRVKKIHEEVEAVKSAPIMERINKYENAAEQLRTIVSEKGTGIASSTYNTYRAIKNNDIKLPTKLLTGDDFGDFDFGCTLLTSTLSVWAGWPSNGKTTTIRNIAKRIIQYNDVYDPFIVHLSLDDDNRNTIVNYSSMYTSVQPHKLRHMFDTKKWITSKEGMEYDPVLDDLFREKIHIFNSVECPDIATAGRIMNIMKSIYPNRRMIVIVDALNNFADFNKDNQISAAEAVIRELKRYAVRYDAHIAVIAHFKKHKGDINVRPQLSDLKGTSFLEHEAQNIFLMYMATHYNKNEENMIWVDPVTNTRKPVIEVNIAKDKNHSATTIIPFNFNPDNLIIYPPTSEDMVRYTIVLDKL